MKKSIQFMLVLLCLTQVLLAQPFKLHNPDDILVAGDPLPKVLLVGTFHFNYPGLDAHKTDKSEQIDVAAKDRQKQVEELIDYLARFKPNKIVVEAWNGSNVNDNYKAYLDGDYELRRREIDQLAYRLAKRFDIPELILADASTLVRDFDMGPDSTCIRPTLERIYEDWDFQSDDELSKRYDALYDYGDKMAVDQTLLENFLQMNDSYSIVRGHGAYLVGDFKNGENTEGADALAMHWYARNLRIFRNIQKGTGSPEDRILVLFGAGHLSILKHLFESTPEYELFLLEDLKQ